MSTYIPPALNAVDFALTPHTVPSIASPQQALAAHTVPALNAVDFALVAYNTPTYMDVGWELLPSGGIAYTLVCNAGAYTYSGQSAELTVARNLSLSAGAYSYVGSDATLDYVPGAVNYTLECQPGAYVYTGNDAVLTYEPGVVNYDTHDGGDEKKRIHRFKKQKEELRAQLEEAMEAANAVSVPAEIAEVQKAIPVALTKEDIAEVTNEVNLLITQIYMRIAMEKAAQQDEDDVETLMLLNG